MVKLRPACLAPDLVKDTNCQKICSLLRRPETVQKTKKAIFLKMINKLFICKFFKDFTNDRKSTNKVIAFSCRSLPNILRYRDHTWNLPTIRTIRDSFRHINNLTNMYESSGSMAFSSNLWPFLNIFRHIFALFWPFSEKFACMSLLSRIGPGLTVPWNHHRIQSGQDDFDESSWLWLS